MPNKSKGKVSFIPKNIETDEGFGRFFIDPKYGSCLNKADEKKFALESYDRYSSLWMDFDSKVYGLYEYDNESRTTSRVVTLTKTEMIKKISEAAELAYNIHNFLESGFADALSEIQKKNLETHIVYFDRIVAHKQVILDKNFPLSSEVAVKTEPTYEFTIRAKALVDTIKVETGYHNSPLGDGNSASRAKEYEIVVRKSIREFKEFADKWVEVRKDNIKISLSHRSTRDAYEGALNYFLEHQYEFPKAFQKLNIECDELKKNGMLEK